MINFARANAELRRAFNLLSYQLIIKGCNSGIARWDRFTEQGMGGGMVWSFPDPLNTSLFPNLHMITNPEDLWTLSFWVFTEASSHRHYWLNHRPLVIDSIPGDRGWDWKFLLSRVWFPEQPAPSLGAFPKNLIHINSGVMERGLLWILRHFYCCYHLGNYKSFRGSVPETNEDQIYISYYESQYHTQ